jgi:hypothetical protein
MQMEITLRNKIDGGKEKYILNPVIGEQFTLYTVSFESKHDNDDDIDVDPDTTDVFDTDVFADTETINGANVNLLYDAGDLYLTSTECNCTNATCSPAVENPCNNSWIGVNMVHVSQSDDIDDVEVDGNTMDIRVWNENATSIGDSGTELNDYSGSKTSGRADTDDTLIEFVNEDGEYVIIDMYDRDFNDSVDVYYGESVKATGAGVESLTNGSSTALSDESAVLNRDTDTVLILPEGGDTITVDYGGDYEVEAVEICHPQDPVDATVFVGTSEEETILTSVITEADVGTTKVAGCCTFTVEEFSVTGAAGGTVASVTVNPIVGNLVVSEIAADTSKNLVVVGGPAVNGLTTVTADEIAAASQRYIVKKDGSKVIVAGWTAGDTIAAGNALVDWLKANVH